jgi:glucose/mannose transport system substrate-binding protein
VFVFPNVDDPAQQAAQEQLAGLMLAPATQLEFNKKKGSVPVRLDVDVSSMDVCAQKGMAALRDPARQIPSDSFLTTPDMYGALQDVITEFWNTPAMDVDTFVENYAAAMEAAS